MEDQAKTELQLSEEDLQEITGGCEECLENRRSIIGLTTMVGRIERGAIQDGQAITQATNGNSALDARYQQLMKLTSVANMRKRINGLQQAIAGRHQQPQQPQ